MEIFNIRFDTFILNILYANKKQIRSQRKKSQRIGILIISVRCMSRLSRKLTRYQSLVKFLFKIKKHKMHLSFIFTIILLYLLLLYKYIDYGATEFKNMGSFLKKNNVNLRLKIIFNLKHTNYKFKSTDTLSILINFY